MEPATTGLLLAMQLLTPWSELRLTMQLLTPWPLRLPMLYNDTMVNVSYLLTGLQDCIAMCSYFTPMMSNSSHICITLLVPVLKLHNIKLYVECHVLKIKNNLGCALIHSSTVDSLNL